MQDIADACGVTKNTVSQALRNQSRVAEKTRKRIQKKAAEMGYKKDSQLTRIMTQLGERRKLKGVIKEEIAYLECIRHAMDAEKAGDPTPTHPDFFKGAEDFLAEQGYRLTCYVYDPEPAKVEHLNRVFDTRGIRGMIVGPLPPDLDNIKLNISRIHAVALGRQLKRPLLDRVDIHHASHCRLCVQKLHQQGCKRIGMVLPSRYDHALHNVIRSTYLGEISLLFPKEAIPPILDVNYPKHRDISESEVSTWISQNKLDAIIAMDFDTSLLRKTIDSLDPSISLAVERLESDFSEHGARANARGVGRTAAQSVISSLTYDQPGPTKQPKITLIPGKWHSAKK